MIPILYAKTETTFTSNGLGRLADCTRCVVTEERNGSYECEFSYPISGKHYADIEEGCFIACTHDDDGDVQPFEIYRRSAPINGIVTFNARHLSYRLSFVILNPFSATNIADALTGFTTSNINTNPFTFWTDKTTYAPFSVDRPASVRSVMGGVEGSILDVYGGEWDFDKWAVKLWANRGTNSGVTIRYGKNLSDIEQTVDVGSAYNSVVPYWAQETEDGVTLVTLPERVVTPSGVTDVVPVVLDMSSEFTEAPTEAQLRTAASDFLTKTMPWLPSENIKVDFVQLWQTTEYASVANLQKVRLCDTVNVYYPALGITINDIKVIKVVYNVLADKYDEMELGQPSASFADAITADLNKQIVQSQRIMEGFFDAAINTATELMSGNAGGHLVIKYDVNGKPQQLLIMDTESELTATNILRISLNGIGFSSNGGVSYSTAWTLDGQFVADFITTGTLRTIMIEGPNGTGWNLLTGRFTNYDESTVTAQVETSSGTYSTVSYDVKHKLCIDDGLMQLTGTVDNSQEQIELFELGLNGDGMTYDFYDVTPAGDSTSYPYTGLKLSGSRIDGRARDGDGGAQHTDAIAATYIPGAVITPDYIELGQANDLKDSNDNPVSTPPNRNLLHLGAGWIRPEDSIYFIKNYAANVGSLGQITARYYGVKKRVAWEYVQDDFVDHIEFYGAATLGSSKKAIFVTIPLCRPISKDVTSLSATATVYRMWQNGSVLVNSETLADDTEVISWSDGGVVLALKKQDGTAWTSGGTNLAPVSVRLQEVYISFR